MSYFNALVIIIILFSSALLVQNVTPARLETGGVIWDTYTDALGFLAMTPTTKQSWRSSSLGKCVLESTIRYAGATTIRYDEETRVCDAGQWLRIIDTAQSYTAGTHFYSRSPIVCVEDGEFSFQHTATVYMCAYTSTQRLTYPAAKQACEDKNATLVIPKIVGLFELSQSVAENIHEDVWIGLEKNQLTGSYHWADGEIFLEDTDLWNVTWDKGHGQPDSPSDVEHLCVFLHGQSKEMHDEDCAKELLFICDRR